MSAHEAQSPLRRFLFKPTYPKRILFFISVPFALFRNSLKSLHVPRRQDYHTPLSWHFDWIFTSGFHDNSSWGVDGEWAAVDDDINPCQLTTLNQKKPWRICDFCELNCTEPWFPMVLFHSDHSSEIVQYIFVFYYAHGCRRCIT